MPHSPGQPPLDWNTIAVQLAVVFALVLANGFFVSSEFALVSLRKTRIDQLAAEGNRSALLVQDALRNINRYIAATQVGITVASPVLGGLGEQTLEPLFHRGLSALGVPVQIAGVGRVVIATALAYFVMTAFHVIIGELVPKSFTLQKAEMVAMLIARPMALFVKLSKPLVWLLNGAGTFLLRRMGIQAAEGHAQVHSPEELNILFDDSHAGGELTANERDMLHRVVKFSEITARAAMVPRVEMGALPIEMTRQELTNYLHGQPHTRVPVFHGSLDEVVGIAHLRDLVRFEATLDCGDRNNGDQKINLMPLVREAVRVPETITIDKLLTEFKRRRQQMAIVIDEYGGTSGLVTMGDLLEQVFGDVRDEFDPETPEVEERADGWIRLHGRILIDEVNERYGLGLNSEDVDTMAGLVQTELGRAALVDDEIEINGAKLRVEHVERLRITSLLLQLPSAQGERENER